MISGLSDRYRIVSTVGSGGMGIVYKAIDTSLNRPVAIKAIRPNLLDDQSARRLRAEAMAAASLDHPYICKVYELIETPTETLIVMEFVEGETLAAKLTRGVPPLDATLLMGSEIAEGLTAAHARGVVHRDIKPSNVMITPHGHVKILDFGLAHDVDSDESTRTTQTGLQSRTGSPAYMSPEQARGREIQPASDLFSLGVLLYECLSGRLPFEGKTGYEYVGNLLTERPLPLATQAPEAPFALVQLVERCLEKDPGWRPESAEAVSRELRLLLEQGARGAAATSVAGWTSHRYRAGTAIALGVVVLAAVGFALRDRIWPPSGALDTARETVPLVTWESNEEDSKLSPDGKWISFVSDRDGPKKVFVRPIDGGNAREVEIQGDVIAHVWSPDGRRIAAYVASGRNTFVQIVPAFFGGSVERSLPITAGRAIDTTARTVRWIGDDIYLVATARQLRDTRRSGRALIRIRVDAGAVEDATPAGFEDSVAFQWFDVHPASGMLVIAAVRDQEEDLWVADATGARARQITDDGYFDRYPVWTGDIVSFQSNRGGQIDLWQVDPSSGRTRLVSSSETEERPEDSSIDGGHVTFQHLRANARLWKRHADGQTERLTNDALSDFAPSVSRDGLAMIFQRHAGSPSLGMTLLDSQLVQLRAGSGTTAAASTTAPAGFFPKISPSGTHVAYFGRQSSGSRFASLFVKDLTTGQIRTVSNQCPLQGFSISPVEWIQQNLAWSDSGLLYFVEHGDAGALVRAFEPVRGGITNVTGVLQARLADLHPSPGGSEIAYLLSRDGRTEARRRVLATGAESVAWTWNGRASDVSLKGWDAERRLVLAVRHSDAQGADGNAMEILAAGPAGTTRVALVKGAHAFSARVAPSGTVAYYTGSTGRADNLFALDLRSGASRPLTTNDLANMSFSGIEPLADGSVIYAQNDQRQDIWLTRTSPRSR